MGRHHDTRTETTTQAVGSGTGEDCGRTAGALGKGQSEAGEKGRLRAAEQNLLQVFRLSECFRHKRRRVLIDAPEYATYLRIQSWPLRGLVA